MTATRWWVKLFARWQARIDSIKGQIQAISLAVTAYSTFSLLLQNSGYGEYVMPMGIILAIGGPVYAYLFFEGGVWNQVSRDRQEKSSNFASPSQKIGNELGAAGIVAGLQGRELTEKERNAMEHELERVFEKNWEGMDMEEYD